MLKENKINYSRQDTIVPYVVKRINNRLYVYRQFRAGKKVVSIYIGPLEEIAEFYLKHKKEFRKEKRRGRDLNPGAPTGASDLESDPLDLTQAPRPKL